MHIPDLSNLEIVTADWPVPRNYAGFKADKGAKIRLGVEHLLRNPTKYAMNLDADDRVHRRLVEFTEANDSKVGWVIDKGYVYRGGHFVRSHKGKFERLCGSSFILRVGSQDNVGEHLLLGHTQVREYFVARGAPLPSLPFFGVVKVVGYGDNLSKTLFVRSESMRRTLRKLLRLRPVGSRFRNEFALSDE